MKSRSSFMLLPSVRHFGPSAGKVFASWKTGQALIPRSQYDADLIIHLEGDGQVRSYQPLNLVSFLGSYSEVSHEALTSFVCYRVEHKTRTSVFLLEPERVGVAFYTAEVKLHEILLQQGQTLTVINRQYLYQEPRWSNLRQIFECRNRVVSPSDRLNIVNYVDAFGRAEIEDCASLCQFADDPVASVLALVADATLRLDMDVRIGMTSLVMIP